MVNKKLLILIIIILSILFIRVESKKEYKKKYFKTIMNYGYMFEKNDMKVTINTDLPKDIKFDILVIPRELISTIGLEERKSLTHQIKTTRKSWRHNKLRYGSITYKMPLDKGWNKYRGFNIYSTIDWKKQSLLTKIKTLWGKRINLKKGTNKKDENYLVRLDNGQIGMKLNVNLLLKQKIEQNLLPNPLIYKKSSKEFLLTSFYIAWRTLDPYLIKALEERTNLVYRETNKGHFEDLLVSKNPLSGITEIRIEEKDSLIYKVYTTGFFYTSCGIIYESHNIYLLKENPKKSGWLDAKHDWKIGPIPKSLLFSIQEKINCKTIVWTDYELFDARDKKKLDFIVKELKKYYLKGKKND